MILADAIKLLRPCFYFFIIVRPFFFLFLKRRGFLQMISLDNVVATFCFFFISE